MTWESIQGYLFQNGASSLSAVLSVLILLLARRMFSSQKNDEEDRSLLRKTYEDDILAMKKDVQDIKDLLLEKVAFLRARLESLEESVDSVDSSITELVRQSSGSLTATQAFAIARIYFAHDMEIVQSWFERTLKENSILDKNGNRSLSVLNSYDEFFRRRTDRTKAWWSQFKIEGRDASEWFDPGMDSFYNILKAELYNYQYSSSHDTGDAPLIKNWRDHVSYQVSGLVDAMRIYTQKGISLEKHLSENGYKVPQLLGS